MIIDVDWDWDHDEDGWDAALKPIGERTPHKETFESWWKRCKHHVPNLHPMIAEQWIYRHWGETHYGYLPLRQLTWRLEIWSSADIFDRIYVRPNFGELHPENDFKWTQGNEFKALNLKETEPHKSLAATGTWNYPILVIETPEGVRTEGEHIKDVRFCLIEGHTRFRFLKAWEEGRAFTAEQHEIFVLNLTP